MPPGRSLQPYVPTAIGSGQVQADPFSPQVPWDLGLFWNLVREGHSLRESDPGLATRTSTGSPTCPSCRCSRAGL